jgi:hypothetical protein
MKTTLKTRLPELSERDRRLLRVGVPVAVLLLMLIILKPLLGSGGSADADLDRALEDIAWLKAQGSQLPSQASRCPPAVWQSGRLSTLARRYGLELSSPPKPAAGMVDFAIASADGNQALAFAQVLECQGATIDTLELALIPGAGAVSGSLTALIP